MTVNYFSTGATLGVYVGFPNGVTDTSWTWTDVTGDVVIDEPLRIQRGRSSERDTFQTGTASFALLNTARKYDPEHASGPYFGNLLPGRPCKIELTYSATTTVLFFGFIQGWPQAWERSDNKSIVNIVAHDAFKYLALAQLPESRYAVEVLSDTPTAWYRLGETADNLVCADSSGNARNGQYAAALSGTPTTALIEFGTDGARAITGSSDAGSDLIAGGLHYLSGTTWSWECWMTIPTDSDTSAYNDVPQTIWAQSTAPLAFGVVTALTTEPIITAPGIRVRVVRNISLFLECQIQDGTNTYNARFNVGGILDDGDRHHVTYTRNGATLTLYIDGTARTFTTTTGTLTAGSSTFGTYAWFGAIKRGAWVFDELALYSTTLSAGTVTDHHTAGTTAGAGDDIDARIAQVLTDAGMSWLPTSLADSQVATRGAQYDTTVLAYLQALERTEQGRLFIAGDGTLTFYDYARDVSTSVAAAFTDVAGGSLPYVECQHEFDDTRVINDVTASRVNGTPVRVSDATSKTEYGIRAATVDGLQCEDDETAAGVASYVLNRYKAPAPRIRALVVQPRANIAGLFPAVRDLEIGDKVTVRRLPLGTGSAFTKTLMVEGVTHSIGVDGEWVTTYLTSPAETTVALWDSGLWDQETWGI